MNTVRVTQSSTTALGTRIPPHHRSIKEVPWYHYTSLPLFFFPIVPAVGAFPLLSFIPIVLLRPDPFYVLAPR